MSYIITELQNRLIRASQENDFFIMGDNLVIGSESSPIYNRQASFQHLLASPIIQQYLDSTTDSTSRSPFQIPECAAKKVTVYVPPVAKITYDDIMVEAKTVCWQMLIKNRRRFADLLPGGRYCNPTSETRRRLATAPATNDASERTIGMLKWIMQSSPSMTIANASNFAKFRINKPFEEFSRLPASEQQRRIEVAMAMRKALQKKTRADERQLQIKKMVAVRDRQEDAMRAEVTRTRRRTSALKVKLVHSIEEVPKKNHHHNHPNSTLIIHTKEIIDDIQRP
jgi:hypothetical protein